jgi:hypothetical protein
MKMSKLVEVAVNVMFKWEQMAHIRVKMASSENGKKTCAIAHTKLKMDRRKSYLTLIEFGGNNYKCHHNMKSCTNTRKQLLNR